MKIGYSRVSTSGQSLDAQIAALKAEGCEEIFEEKMSGKTAEGRKQLMAALQMCRKNDVLIVTKIDRLARSMTDLWSIVGKLEEKKCALKVLDQPLINTSVPEGKVVISLMGYLAEMERLLIRERTSNGRVRAKEKGVQFGRRASLNPSQLQSLRSEVSGWEGSMSELGRKYGISRSSVYRLRLAATDSDSSTVC